MDDNINMLRVYSKVKAFQEGKFYLRETIKLLDTTRMILDTALLSSLDKERMTKGIKEMLNYEVEIKTGSIDAYIQLGELAYNAVPLLTPVAADITGHLKEIVEYVKNAKKLIEWLGAKHNQGVTVEVKDSPGAVVLVASDGSTIHSDHNELYGSLRLFKPLKQLSNLCDGKNVECVQFFDGKEKEPTVVMEPSMQKLYSSESAMENLTVSLVGTLFDLNTKTRKGKLDTGGEGNSVPIQVDLNLNIHAFSDAVYDKGPITFSAKPLMNIINGVSSVSGYELISFEAPKQSELDI